MQNNLFFSLTLNISLLVLMATILTEVRPLRMILKRQDRSVSSQLVLGAIFGVLSISCTYTGLAFQGAVVNTRVVSTVAAIDAAFWSALLVTLVGSTMPASIMST